MAAPVARNAHNAAARRDGFYPVINTIAEGVAGNGADQPLKPLRCRDPHAHAERRDRSGDVQALRYLRAEKVRREWSSVKTGCRACGAMGNCWRQDVAWAG